jgi:hypothetical protein
MVFTTSIAVVFIAPVIMIAACVCIDANLFIMAQLFWLSFAYLPMFCCGVKQMLVVCLV